MLTHCQTILGFLQQQMMDVLMVTTGTLKHVQIICTWHLLYRHCQLQVMHIYRLDALPTTHQQGQSIKLVLGVHK